LPEMVDETVGTLFTMGDIDSMSSAILTLLADKDEMQKRGEKGRERVLSNFTYKGNAEEYSSIYYSLV